MANPTTNFGWVMPTSTDLVTDLPADFAVFGQAVDTTLMDLKGGTTGQVLSKASNTDMDFTWTAAGDITGVTATSPLTGGGTSGDLTIGIASSAVVPSQTGNSGKYLTTDGTTSSWGSISAGGMTLLSSISLSGNSSVTFSSISGSYVNLYLYVKDTVINSGTGKFRIWFNGSTNNSDYSFVSHNTTASAGGTATPSFTYYSRAGYVIPTSTCLNSNYGHQVTMDLKYYVNAGQPAPLFDILHSGSQDGTNQQVGRLWGSEMAATTVTSISYGTDTSTFAAGTAYLYGVK